MFKITISIESVDYSSVIPKLLPVVISKIDKDSTLGQALQKFQTMPVIMAQAAILVLPKDMQDNLAVYFLSVYSEDIVKRLNDFVESEQIGIGFDSVDIEKGSSDTAINLTIKINSLDYESLALKTMPMIADKLEQKLSTDFAFQLITLLKRVPNEAYITFLRSIPDDIKDELAVLLLSEYEGKINAILNNIAEKESISLKIGHMSVSKGDKEIQS